MNVPFKLALIATLAGLVVQPAVGQDNAVDYQKLQQVMEKAQAEANRPGDEKLDCAALESEMIAAATAPAVQAHIARSGEQAQKNSASSKPSGAALTAQTAVTVFASLVQGGGWASVLQGQAQMPMQRAQTMQNLQQRMQQTAQMMEIMPQLMRGQRVLELAQQRSCDWMPPASVTGSDADKTPAQKK